MNLRIREVRKQAGQTQKEFANALNLTENYVILLEKGTRTPSERTKADICRIYGIEPLWLDTGKGSMKIPQTTEEELNRFFSDVMNDLPESFRKRFIIALARMRVEQWEHLADIAETFVGE